jgi:DNA-3-methyladenine glycosylase
VAEGSDDAGADGQRLLGSSVPVVRERVAGPAEVVAPSLLGALLVHEQGDGRVLARVVEVEAYGRGDPASHAARGPRPGNASMFASPGTAYVYRSYGVHWCCNVVVDGEGVGAAVLVRAARVLEGEDVVRRRRSSVARTAHLLRGPGCLTRGLGIDARHDGIDLLDATSPLRLHEDGWRPLRHQVGVGPRTGVSRAAETPWRYFVRGAPEVSAYRRSPRAPRRDTAHRTC